MIYGLAAALGWGLADFGGAVVARRLGSVWTVLLSQLCTAGVMTVLLLEGGHRIGVLGPVLGWVVLNGLVGAAAYALHYRALQLGPVAVVSPIGAAYALVGLVLAVVLLGERPSGPAIAGAIVTVVGVMLASADLRRVLEGRHERAPGLLFALASAFLFGVAGFILAWLSKEVGWVVGLWSSRVGQVVALAAVGFALGRGSAPGPVRATAVAGALAVGLADLLGVVTYAIGAERGFVSVVVVASCVFPLIAVALSVLLLGERPVANQYVGVALVASGLVLLGVG
ncbi:MAG: membrane protein [Actinomycetota bacterium]|nr:MAG: membrane protein [Actinomycetota bacterium]